VTKPEVTGSQARSAKRLRVYGHIDQRDFAAHETSCRPMCSRSRFRAVIPHLQRSPLSFRQICFRSVDSVKANNDSVNDQRVAVNNSGRTGYISERGLDANQSIGGWIVGQLLLSRWEPLRALALVRDRRGRGDYRCYPAALQAMLSQRVHPVA